MDKIIQAKINILKSRIKTLKGKKGVDRDIQRQSNRLTEYKISKLKTRNDAISNIKQICHTDDFGKIYIDLKKLIKLVDKYKHQATTYKNKYNHLSSSTTTNASTTPPTLVMGDHYDDQTNKQSSNQNHTQSDNSSSK